jgi:hypothetical protein
MTPGLGLGHHWQEATATVLAVETYQLNAPGLGGGVSHCDLILEVQARAAPPFRAETRVDVQLTSLAAPLRRLKHFAPPAQGDTLRVEYEERSHKVRVLQDDAHDQRLRDKAESDEWQATLDAPPGSTRPPAPSSAEPRTVNSPDLAAAQASGALGPAEVAAVNQALDRLQGSAPQDPVTVTNLGQPDVPAGQPQVISAADVLARGLPATATLLGTIPDDRPSPEPGFAMLGLVLSVAREGQAPFQVQAEYKVPLEKLHQLSPGAVLPVKVDTVVPGVVAVDWQAL